MSGQNEHHQVNYSICIYVQMGNTEENPLTLNKGLMDFPLYYLIKFIRMVVSCSISFTTQRPKSPKIAGIANVKKLINQSGCFEDTAKFYWQTKELLENMRCLSV